MNLRLVWMGLSLLSAIPACAAEPPPVLPAADFARPAKMGAIRFSPDGKHFAAMAEDKNQMKLVVVEYATNQGRSFYSEYGADIASFRWINDDLIVINTTKRGTRQDELKEVDFLPLYISLSGKSRVTPRQAAKTLRSVPGSPDELIVANFPYGGGFSGAQRLDIIDATNGEFKRHLTDEPPGPGVRWILDNKLVPRAAIGWIDRTSTAEIWWRESPAVAWRKVKTFQPASERWFYPVAVDDDGQLLVLSNIATGRFALHKFDPVTSQPGELLAGHPIGDIDENDLRYSTDRLSPIGLNAEGDQPQDYWFDPKRQAVQDLIDKSLPSEAVNRLQFLISGKVLVFSSSPKDPGTYYFYDPAARSLTEWSRVMPWIQPEQMGTTRAMRYAARDGLSIPAYLTLPAGRDPKQLPLLVWVHGGPQSRDRWHFDSEVQFFANRGYAVLQVNFRGSMGFGDEFMRAGFRQWGRAMQDDLTDGVRKLIADGTVDARRVCIGGASYGGYAALMGPVREPDLYRCAIDLYGPSDLTWTVELPEIDYNWGRNPELDKRLRERIGDPDDSAQRPAMDANSPRQLAARIKSPVLLVYGTDDWRVPLRQGTGMRSALESAGAKFEWKSFTGEGHGVRAEQSSTELLLTMEKFLNRHIGPTAAAQTAAK